MRTKMWTQYTYRVRIDELGRGLAARGPRAEGGRGEESFKRSNTPDTRVGGFLFAQVCHCHALRRLGPICIGVDTLTRSRRAEGSLHVDWNNLQRAGSPLHVQRIRPYRAGGSPPSP